MLHRFVGFLGLIVILLVAVALSSNRRAIRLRIIAWGLGLQFSLAFLVLYTPFRFLLEKVRDGAMKMLGYAIEGSRFVFGPLGFPEGGFGVVFAFQVLPIVIFIASFFAVMYYLGIMQVIVRAFAKVMTVVMGASGAEALDVAASIFMGQTEAPLTIRPYLEDLTMSELMTVMTSGMAHVSGAVMGAYVLVGKVDMLHLLTAVIMTAPATIMLAKVLVPETETPRTAGGKLVAPDVMDAAAGVTTTKSTRASKEGAREEVEIKIQAPDVNIIDAAARGAGEGLHLALNIGAMLVAFIALIALTNGIFGWVHYHVHFFPASLQVLFSWLFAPVAWLLGVSWKDAAAVGNLLGTRLVLNEFVAFTQLGPIKDTLDPRSFVIATYALCGFANFSSIGIQIGGIGALIPNRRHDLARLGLRAVLAGTMANFMSAAIVGLMMR